MIDNYCNLSGKKVLVTGASSGIGASIAVACANLGATVFYTGRSKEKLQKTNALIPPGDHKAIIADLTQQADLQRLVASLPKLDGIVHSMGVGGRQLCKDIRPGNIDDIFSPNFYAPVLLQSLILSEKKVEKGASIVFIASKAADYPSIGNAIYSASKGAIISYAKVLALELAGRKIRVNCISPAMVWTDLIMQNHITKEELEEAEKKYPLKRYGKPEDIVPLAIYLLADGSGWMTGSNIDITGGTNGL